MTYKQTPQLLNLWASEHGLRRLSARVCNQCPIQSDQTDPKTTLPPRRPAFWEQSRLGEDHSPPHLHIHLEVGFYLACKPEEASRMMRECDLPYQLNLNHHSYFMRARGFWATSHYWCHVVRNVGGITGVWLHNDMKNAGVATLVSTDLETIGGPSENTTWAMYSRAPTPEEDVIIKKSQAKIMKSVGNKGAAEHPFSQIQEPNDVWEDYEADEGSTGVHDEEEGPLSDLEEDPEEVNDDPDARLRDINDWFDSADEADEAEGPFANMGQTTIHSEVYLALELTRSTPY